MHQGDDCEPSNHEKVMEAFESCGYVIRLQQVCPSNCGIPMTRQRVHYVGLRMAAVPDAKAQMDEFADVWRTILAGQFKQYKLEDFLDDSSGGRLSQSQSKPGTLKERKWSSVHQAIFDEYEARPAGPDSRFIFLSLITLYLKESESYHVRKYQMICSKALIDHNSWPMDQIFPPPWSWIFCLVWDASPLPVAYM